MRWFHVLQVRAIRKVQESQHCKVQEINGRLTRSVVVGQNVYKGSLRAAFLLQ
jgi:hypothetical protein